MLGDELLVYDLERDRAHALDPLAAAVWHAADGRRAGAALHAEVERQMGAPVAPVAVDYGLVALALASPTPAFLPFSASVTIRSRWS
jgi:hypothetical protein